MKTVAVDRLQSSFADSHEDISMVLKTMNVCYHNACLLLHTLLFVCSIANPPTQGLKCSNEKSFLPQHP